MMDDSIDHRGGDSLVAKDATLAGRKIRRLSAGADDAHVWNM